jgi:hypothetical protein
LDIGVISRNRSDPSRSGIRNTGTGPGSRPDVLPIGREQRLRYANLMARRRRDRL